MALLELRDLHTFFKTKKGIVKAVNGVSYQVDAGRTLGIVGESGSGKSVSAMSILQLLDGNGYIDSGEIIFEDRDLTKCTKEEMYKIRGNKISVIFQEPMTSLNPVFTVERQLNEVFLTHQKVSKKEASKRSLEMLAAVKIPNPERVLKQYPHQLSGGMRQRVMIAMALACRPKVLIADEPTTALDVTIQAQILDLLQELEEQYHTSIVLITHDMGVVATVCQRVAIMYGGLIMETGTSDEIFYDPKHPYTKALLRAIPSTELKEGERLQAIEGLPPSLVNPPAGCPFAERCEYASERCAQQLPEYYEFSGTHRAMCHLYDQAQTNGKEAAK